MVGKDSPAVCYIDSVLDPCCTRDYPKVYKNWRYINCNCLQKLPGK